MGNLLTKTRKKVSSSSLLLKRHAARKAAAKAKPAKTFNITKVKWSWPKDVKAPEVYRDDEYIKTKTKEDALDAITWLMPKHQGSYTYTITVKRDGEYYTYFQHSMPCLGGLVKYKITHGDKYSMNPYFPRDIRVMFPQGDITYIAVHAKIKMTKLHEFILSSESPWISAFGDRKYLEIKNDHILLSNMNADPNVFYHLLRYSGFCFGNQSQLPDWDPRAQILAMRKLDSDPRRLAAQRPIKLSAGTWAQGYGYTRPLNESVFKTRITKELKDFDEKTAYGSEFWKLDCVLAEEMKKLYKVTVPSWVEDKDRKALEKPLIEAWEYFKGKAGELPSDIPGK